MKYKEYKEIQAAKSPEATIVHSSPESRRTVATIGGWKYPTQYVREQIRQSGGKLLLNLWLDIQAYGTKKQIARTGESIGTFKAIAVCDPRDEWSDEIGEKVATAKVQMKYQQYMFKKFANLALLLDECYTQARDCALAHIKAYEELAEELSKFTDQGEKEE